MTTFRKAPRAAADGHRRAMAAQGDWQPPPLPTAIFGLVILAAQLVPPLPQYLGASSSMALGMVLAAAVCVLAVAVNWALSGRGSGAGPLEVPVGSILTVVTVITVVLLHGVVADQLVGVAVGRFAAALIPLVFLLAGGLALGSAIRGARPQQVERVMRVSFWCLVGIIVLKATGLQPRGHVFEKSTFPFTETSHFALALAPVFLYRCARSARRWRLAWIVAGIVLALALQSATMLIIAFAAAFISRRVAIFFLLGLLAFAAALSVELNLKYFTSRADISDKSSNLSALVYVEGWEMMDRSLYLTDGWGVGFEQLGLHDTNVAAVESILRLTGGVELNLTDGGFVLAKLGGEFGILGLLLSLGYCVLAVRSAFRLRDGGGTANAILAQCIVVAFCTDMFARGTGYFTQSGLLFLGGMFSLVPRRSLLRISLGPSSEKLVVIR